MAVPLQPGFIARLSNAGAQLYKRYQEKVLEQQLRDKANRRKFAKTIAGDDSSDDEPTPTPSIFTPTYTPGAEAKNTCCPSTTNNFYQSSNTRKMSGMYSRGYTRSSGYKRKYRGYKRKYGRRGFLYRRRGAYRPNLTGYRLNVEKKWLDDYGSFIPLGSGRSTASVVQINDIDQGAGQNQRIGLKVRFTDIMLRIWIQGTTTPTPPPAAPNYYTGTAPQLIRIMLVWYKQNDQQDRTVANNVIGDVLQYSTGSAPMNSPLRLPNASTEFKVLYDKVHNIGGVVTPCTQAAGGTYTAGTPIAISPNQVGDDMYKKVNLTTSYTSVTGTPTNISYGCMYLFGISSFITSPAATSDPLFPLVNYQTRLRYVDN